MRELWRAAVGSCCNRGCWSRMRPATDTMLRSARACITDESMRACEIEAKPSCLEPLVAKAVLLPIVLTARTMVEMTGSGRLMTRLPVLFWLALMQSAWALGEAIGALTGVGEKLERVALMRIGIDASCWWNRRGFGRFTRGLLPAMFAASRGHRYCLFGRPAPGTGDDPRGCTGRRG